MVTRIDTVLGTDIFQSIQDKVPRSIGIMVGMAYTSGGLVTGRRKYEKSFVCREIINPCIRKRGYSCHDCELSGAGCHGGQGNRNCIESDYHAGDEARKTMMTVLYRCYFGLANFAIPVPIGELSTITLYGGQFRINLDEKDNPVIEEYEEGKRIGISQKDFVDVVTDIYEWRKKREKEQSVDFVVHPSLAERNEIISNYLSDPYVTKKTIRVEGCTEPWGLERLENILRERYGLSLVENWKDFLSPPSEKEIEDNRSKVAAFYFKETLLTWNGKWDKYHIRGSVDEALTKYDETMKPFFGYKSKNPKLNQKATDNCKESTITLRKALSTIETLKELALLISKTANIVFYKDTYFMLRNLWNNHPVSVLESFDERWVECEALLHQLDTSGKEVLLPVKKLTSNEIRNQPFETQRHLNLVRRLTKNLMFFAYKMLSDDFRSTILFLQKNYDLQRRYPGEEEEAMEKLIGETKTSLADIRAISSFFIRDLLQSKYEQNIQDIKQDKKQDKRTKLSAEDHDMKELEQTLDEIKMHSTEDFEKTQRKLEDYVGGKSLRLACPLNGYWTTEIFDLLEKTASHPGRIQAEDIMLNFFNLVFKGKRQNDEQEELKRLNVNLRWADTAIREQVENMPTSVLQFDICQSLLNFMQRLRENAYATRFEVIRKLALRKGFASDFLNPKEMACSYFIDHGIGHALRVLGNVSRILKSAQGESKWAEDGNGTVHFPLTPEERFRRQVKDRNETEAKNSVEEEGCGCIDNVCRLPLWQYYLSCSALLHDVGMFSAKLYEEIYGGPATIRRCHGAFSGKKIVEESMFDIFGNELDRQIIAQICAFHQGSADLSLLHRNIQPLAAILRLADEFDVCQKRLVDVAPEANKKWLDKITDKALNPKGIYQAIARFNKQQGTGFEIPAQNLKSEDIGKLEKQVLDIAEELAERRPEFKNLWPINIPPFEFVQRQPKYEDEMRAFIDVLRACSEIKSVLDAESHYKRHWCVNNVEIKEIARGKNKKYLIPEISLTKLGAPSQADKVKANPQNQPMIIAEVKAKFRREIEFVRNYLEPVGIHFRSPRVSKNNQARNLLFINAPSCHKMKFIGAPTSLLYAIAPIACLVDNDEENENLNPPNAHKYENVDDINIEIWDPECFGKDEEEELQDIMKDLNPKIVGISNTSAAHSNALKMAEIIKKVAKKENFDAVVIFGGPHENVCCEKTIKDHHNCVDISIGGVEEPFEVEVPKKCTNGNGKSSTLSYRADAEFVLRRIVMKILDSEGIDLPTVLGSETDYKDVQGKFKIAFYDCKKHAPGKPIQSKDATDIDLDSLPLMPRYLLTDHKRYDYDIFRDHIMGRLRKTAQVITTRGCPHRCVFCSSSGRSSRRKISNVLAELTSLKDEGYEAIFFDDSTFADKCQDKLTDGNSCKYTGEPCPVVMSKEDFDGHPPEWKNEYQHGRCGYAIKLCHEMVKNDFGFIWGCQTRADIVHGQLLDIMKRSGCVYVYFGVESMNDKVLACMLKDLSAAQIKNGIKETTSKGLDVGISLVFGLEQEAINKVSLLDEKLAVADRLPTSISDTIEGIHDILYNPEYAGSRVSCVSINVAVVYPGTQLERVFKDRGIPIPNFDKSAEFERDDTAFEFEDAGPSMPCLELKPENKGIESRFLMRLILEYCREKIGNKLI